MELQTKGFKTWQIDSDYCQLMKRNDGANFVVLKENIDELIGLLTLTKQTMKEIAENQNE